jgi:predicted RNase H-like nuclease
VLETRTGEIQSRQLIEVYPHTALIRLFEASKRLPYKEAKRRKYWPELSVEKRTHRLKEVRATIAGGLDEALPGLRNGFPLRALSVNR